MKKKPPELYEGYAAIYVENFDGDTCTLDLDLGLDSWMRNQSIRLKDVWCDEISFHNDASVDARNKLGELLKSAIEIRVKTFRNKNKKEIRSFTRWIGEIWIKTSDEKWLCVNEAMIDSGLATRYPRQNANTLQLESVKR